MENFLDQFYELIEEIQSMSMFITEADTISLFTGNGNGIIQIVLDGLHMGFIYILSSKIYLSLT